MAGGTTPSTTSSAPPNNNQPLEGSSKKSTKAATTNPQAIATPPAAVSSGPVSSSSLPASGSSAAPPVVQNQTATQSSVSSPSHSPAISYASSNGNNFSAGSVAGAAVGSAVGAALITFLVLFFLYRKRMRGSGSRGNSSNDWDSSHGVATITEKPKAAYENADFNWQAYLPQAADDRTIQRHIKTLFDQVELHVDNYYRKADVEITDAMRQALVHVDTGKLPLAIDLLMSNSRTSLSVIKHCIVALLIQKLSPGADPYASLLPPQQSEAPAKLSASNMSENERVAAQQAYSQWRVLTSFLFPRNAQNDSHTHGIEGATAEISELLVNAFAPWQDGDRNTVQQHEKNLVMTAGTVGRAIISQPSAYEFKWNAARQGSASARSLVVLPGFWKTSDSVGRVLGEPQMLVAPVSVKV